VRYRRAPLLSPVAYTHDLRNTLTIFEEVGERNPIKPIKLFVRESFGEKQLSRALTGTARSV
jgi:hypothetical protein